MQRILQLGALVLVPLTASCIGLAAGAGFLVSQDIRGNEHTAHVTYDVDRVWPVAQSAVREMAGMNPVSVTSGVPRTIKTRIDGRDVTVTVEAYDVNQSLIRIQAWHLMVADSAQADRVRDRIIARLAQQ
jgi:hypothetical protein